MHKDENVQKLKWILCHYNEYLPKHFLKDITITADYILEFTRPEFFYVDMFYVMDLSKSMKDDIDNLKSLGKDLEAAMNEERFIF